MSFSRNYVRNRGKDSETNASKSSERSYKKNFVGNPRKNFNSNPYGNLEDFWEEYLKDLTGTTPRKIQQQIAKNKKNGERSFWQYSKRNTEEISKKLHV